MQLTQLELKRQELDTETLQVCRALGCPTLYLCSGISEAPLASFSCLQLPGGFMFGHEGKFPAGESKLPFAMVLPANVEHSAASNHLE